MNIDKTLPVISVATPEDYRTYTVGTALEFCATDAGSGIDSPVIGHLDDGCVMAIVESGYVQR